MAQIQSEFGCALGASDLSLVAYPKFTSPYVLLSIMYNRKKTEAIDIIVEAIQKGQTYRLDYVLSTGHRNYTFPNVRVPYPISLDPEARVRFRTEGVTKVDESQSVRIQWSQA